MMFQIVGVNRIFVCVVMVCDIGNDFLFRKNGGIVFPEGDLKVVTRPGSSVANIRRKGNMYAMGVWVKKDKVVKNKNGSAMGVGGTLSFSRQGVRK